MNPTNRSLSWEIAPHTDECMMCVAIALRYARARHHLSDVQHQKLASIRDGYSATDELHRVQQAIELHEAITGHKGAASGVIEGSDMSKARTSVYKRMLKTRIDDRTLNALGALILLAVFAGFGLVLMRR